MDSSPKGLGLGLSRHPSDDSMSASQQPSPSRRQLQRIHFPPSGLPGTSMSDAGPSSSNPSPIGLGLRSLEAAHSGRYPNRLSASSFLGVDPLTDSRRRVRSAGNASDAARPSSSYSRNQYVGTTRSTESSRRIVSYNPEGFQRTKRSGTSSIGSSPLAAGALLPPEDDAQDESPEDANILAELRNALQYRPHVEQHLKGQSPLSDAPASTLSSTTHTTPSNMSPMTYGSKSPLPISIPLSEPQTPSNSKNEFIDFSPSVGTASLHPVPSSSDDCATLDWSFSSPDEDRRERKWSLSLSRKPSSEKNLKLSRKALVEKQERSFIDKLSGIREKIDPRTQRKTEIVKMQLERRYATLHASFSPESTPLDPLEAIRWFAAQDETYRRAVTEEDPSLWLQHLKAPLSGNARQAQWNLTALIVEKYMQASDPRFAFPSAPNDVASDTSSSVSVPLIQRGFTRPISMRSLDQGSMRKESDDRLSFEPIVRSRRGSVDASSRISSDAQARRWRNSLGATEEHEPPAHQQEGDRSRRQTMSSDQHRSFAGHASPITRRSLQFGVKKRSLHSPANSDVEKSSGGEMRSDVRARQASDSRRSRFHLSLDLRSPQTPGDEEKARGIPSFTLADLRTDAFPARNASKTQTLPIANLDASISTEAFDSYLRPQKSQTLGPAITMTPIKTPKAPVQRLSLPTQLKSGSSRMQMQKKQTSAQDEKLRLEYKRKREILEALTTRNNRMKQMLQTASRTIRDHEESQHVLSNKLGVPYSPLSREVLDALSHDPSSVTGHLRNMKGWRAVEEIHSRLTSQSQILHAFAARLATSSPTIVLPEKGIYEDALAKLDEQLQKLQSRRDSVVPRLKQANVLLAQVKRIRDELKPEFDDTSRHTSANYSQLVRLESLLDEIVNEKNPFWRIFEAFLSFSLTSAAPLMKTFGRPIWNELHDFLVIPLYRNDFSGEDAWYPVSFPRRGFLHWLRLLTFAACAPLALSHGLFLFVDLMTQGYLVRVPPFVPPEIVLMLFWSFMSAFAGTLSTLLFVVLCEVFIVLWWTAWLLHIVH